jgi:uncharacterized phosphosugar-binding protein
LRKYVPELRSNRLYFHGNPLLSGEAVGSQKLFGELAEVVFGIVRRVLEEEAQNLERASELVAESIASGGFEYVFGTGHSMLVVLEVFHRAGELVRVYPILDLALLGLPSATRASSLERLPGYARAIVDSLRIVPNSVLVVVSNSGKNAVPVELAYEMRSRGVRVVAVTSVEYSRRLKPENPLGLRLYEVADVVVDNKVPEGDAAYELGDGTRVFPVSTIVNSFIVHSINARAAEILLSRGVEVEVWTSVNIPGGRERNQRYLSKYYDVLKYL